MKSLIENMQFYAINDFFLAFKNVLECVATMNDCFELCTSFLDKKYLYFH